MPSEAFCLGSCHSRWHPDCTLMGYQRRQGRRGSGGDADAASRCADAWKPRLSLAGSAGVADGEQPGHAFLGVPGDWAQVVVGAWRGGGEGEGSGVHPGGGGVAEEPQR